MRFLFHHDLFILLGLKIKIKRKKIKVFYIPLYTSSIICYFYIYIYIYTHIKHGQLVKYKIEYSKWDLIFIEFFYKKISL